MSILSKIFLITRKVTARRKDPEHLSFSFLSSRFSRSQSRAYFSFLRLYFFHFVPCHVISLFLSYATGSITNLPSVNLDSPLIVNLYFVQLSFLSLIASVLTFLALINNDFFFSKAFRKNSSYFQIFTIMSLQAHSLVVQVIKQRFFHPSLQLKYQDSSPFTDGFAGDHGLVL